MTDRDRASDPYVYMFRFCCDPDFNDERELVELDRFVAEARIDDVMVFANVQEINTGHMSFEEQDRYIELMQRVRDVAGAHGATMSVNQWHSVMHADGGKVLRKDQPFRLMVDPQGKSAALSVCPLGEEWQAYIAELYARYAAINPRLLWIEDDFRFHNHAPLSWGGCFCDAHMELFSEKAGHSVTREEFVSGMLQPGNPHPYRAIWLDSCRDALVAVASRIEKAVHAISEVPQLALMTSVPSVHAAEGRDWKALLGAFAGDNKRPANRIHLPAYVEPNAGSYQMAFNRVSMMNRAMISADTEVYPELENFPYSRFAKSRAFTRFQLLGSQPLNPAGMTIDLYDLNGNGIIWQEGYQETLRDTKDFLNRTIASGVFASPLGGVRVLYSESSSYTVHTDIGGQMDELYPQEGYFGALLPALGIPVTYTDDPHIEGEVIAISGQYLRNLPSEIIEKLLMFNSVILDGLAIATLVDLRLGHLVGVAGISWLKHDDAIAAYEEVANGRQYAGIDRARVSTMILSSDVVVLDYLPDADTDIISELHYSDRRVLAPCEVVAHGRTFLFPFGNVPALDEPPRMHLNPVRQQILQEFLSRTDRPGPAVPFVLDRPWVNPYLYDSQSNADASLTIYLVNASTDGYEDVPLMLHDRIVVAVSVDGSDGSGERQVSFVQRNGILTIMHPLGSLETALVRISFSQ